MYNPKLQIDSAYITGRREERGLSPCVLSLTDHSTLYTIGPNRTYCCVVAEKPIHRGDLLIKIQDYLSGLYLFIDLRAEEIPHFCLLISMEWLQEQLSGSALTSLIQKAIEEWQKTGNSVYSKHLVFQRDYQHESYKTLLTQTHCLNLLYQLLTSFLAKSKPEPVEKYKDAELKKVIDIGEAVTIDFQTPVPTIKEMSLMAGMSESKFKKVFQEAFRQSPHQYILEKKLEYAHELLKSGQYTLTQIAYKLGYNHTSGFTRLYRKKRNVSL